MRAGTTGAVGLLVSLALGGCIEDFDPASRIAGARVLGARAEVEGAEGRAWPRPGERVDVPWLVVFPEEARELESLFLLCAAAPTGFGVGFCEGDPVGTSSCDGDADGEGPCVSFEVPDGEMLGDASRVLVLGGICADGTPVADPQERTFECRGEDAEGAPVTFTLPVQRDDASNTHPEIAEVRFEDEPWEPLPPELLGLDTEGCPDDPALPTVPPGEREREITVAMSPGGFDTFTLEDDEGDETERTEEMEVSSFATAGELERQRMVIEREEESSSMKWTPPGAGDVPESGRLVRFHFVARDGRAGITWTHRGMCVSPP